METISEKLVIIAENEQRVYDAGKAAGTIIGDYVDGYNSGLEDGKMAERQDWWNKFTKNETRINYDYGFCYWGKDAFNPTVDIKPTSCARAFMFLENFDLKARLEECGVVLDTSKSRTLSYMFGSALVTAVPAISALNLNSLEAVFNNCIYLTYIDKVILKDSGTNTFTTSTFNAKLLEYIRFEGVIGTNISFQYCPLLSNDSVQDIIDHLKDLTGDTTQTLTFHADVGAKLTEEQKSAIAAKNWTLAY